MDFPFITTLSLVVSTITLLLLFFFLDTSKHVFRDFFAVGFFYNIISLSFFYSFLPGGWSSSPTLQYVVLTLFIILGSLVAATSFLLIPLFFRELVSNRFSAQYIPGFIFTFFVIEDIARSLLLSLLYLGKESSFGLRLFLGSIGEPLASTHFIVFAYPGGVYVLTGIFALLIYLLYGYMTKKLSKKIVVSYSVCLVFIFTALCLRNKHDFASIYVGVMSTAFKEEKTPHDKNYYKNRNETLQNLIQKGEGSDLLILPESSSFVDTSLLFGTTISPEKVPYLLDSSLLTSHAKRGTVSIFYDTKNDTREIRGKDDLMIFSEYSSYLMNDIIKTLASKEDFDAYTEKIETNRSNSYHLFTLPGKGVTFAAMLCSEATSFMPQYFFEKEKPDFYVLQSNLAVMKERPFGLYHYVLYTKLLAATTGKYVVASANMAPSTIVSPLGNITSHGDIGNSLFTQKVPR